jgi:uncharacterized membrane protein HdeD (DUF308 family)
VERDTTLSSGGGTAASRPEAVAQVTEYLIREVHIPAGEARARADAIVGLIGVLPVATRAVSGALAENWWLFLLRGILAVVFGVLTFVQPIAALTALVFVFGVWAFIDGVSALALAISGWRSWQLIVAGLIGLGIGVFTFVRPGITAVALYAAIAAWAIARGILEIVVAVALRREIRDELWLVLGGLASIVFGVLMILLPVAGLLAIAWLLGVYALVYGAIQAVLAVRLRRLRQVGERPPAPVREVSPLPT